MNARFISFGFFLLLFSSLFCHAQLSMPLRSMSISSGFGSRIHPVTRLSDFHRGIDLRAKNEPVFSFFAGRVSGTGFNPLLGKFIKVDHSGLESIYGHLSFILVKIGEEVRSGELIAVTGSTGRVTGEHLHFSLRCDGSYLDPVLFILRYYEVSKINQPNFMENTAYLTLRQKLELLAIVEEVELNDAEAGLYGLEIADREDWEDG